MRLRNARRVGLIFGTAGLGVCQGVLGLCSVSQRAVMQVLMMHQVPASRRVVKPIRRVDLARSAMRRGGVVCMLVFSILGGF